MSPSLKSSGAALWQRPVAAIVTLALCVALVAGAAWTVLVEIERLTSSKADGLQWSLSQADVEFLNFRLQLAAAQEIIEEDSSPEEVQRALRDTRLRFDVFYSRMNTVDFAEPFGSIERQEALTTPRDEVAEFLERTIPDDRRRRCQAGGLAARHRRRCRSHRRRRAGLLACGAGRLRTGRRCQRGQPDPQAQPDRRGALRLHCGTVPDRPCADAPDPRGT